MLRQALAQPCAAARETERPEYRVYDVSPQDVAADVKSGRVLLVTRPVLREILDLLTDEQ